MFCSVVKKGRRNLVLILGPRESRMAPLPVPLFLGVGKKTQIRHVCTNPAWLITHQGNEAELIGQSYSGMTLRSVFLGSKCGFAPDLLR